MVLSRDVFIGQECAHAAILERMFAACAPSICSLYHLQFKISALEKRSHIASASRPPLEGGNSNVCLVLCTLMSTDTLETFPPSTSSLVHSATQSEPTHPQNSPYLSAFTIFWTLYLHSGHRIFESVTFVKPHMCGTSRGKGFSVALPCALWYNCLRHIGGTSSGQQGRDGPKKTPQRGATRGA